MRCEVLHQVLEDDSGFRKYNGLRAIGRLNGDDRRFPQGVDFLQLRRRQHLLPLVDFNRVFNPAALLEEPDETLGTRGIEPEVRVSSVQLHVLS